MTWFPSGERPAIMLPSGQMSPGNPPSIHDAGKSEVEIVQTDEEVAPPTPKR